MLTKFRARYALVAATVLLTSCATPIAAQNTLADKELRETSGIALSRLNNNQLWLLNDGNHPATLYALDTTGKALARLKVRGEKNRDWEDLASFTWRDRHWLVVADIGDNSANHKKSTLHFLEEPQLPARSKKLKLKPTFSIDFTYPDGPRDAESIAYDPLSEEILILSKRDRPAQLYSLPLAELSANPKARHSVKLLGPLPWDGDVPRLSSLLLNPKRVVSHGMATGFDISSDGLQAVILGYQQAVLLRRDAGQTWMQAQITSLPPHRLEQAEAITINHDNRSVFITSEGKNAPLIQQALPK